MKLSDNYANYLEYLRAKGMSPKTIVEHHRFLYGSLSHSIQDVEIDNLRIADIAKVMEAGIRHGKTGPQRSVCVYRRLLKFMKESGLRIPFDWRDLEVPKLKSKPVEYLTLEELEKVRNHLNPNKMADLRTRALIEVLLDTGIRISEACSLDKKDIDWEKKETRVVNAKSKDIEMVYFTDRSIYWLKKYLEKRNDSLPSLFVSGRGRLLTVTSRNYMRTHLDNIGIRKHIKHHIFRKTFATYLIQGGVNIKEVQTLCRHRSERTTLKAYVGVNIEQAKVSHQNILGRLE